MGKIFVAALLLILAYFMFLKRNGPAKEVRIPEAHAAEEQLSFDEPQTSSLMVPQAAPRSAPGLEIPPQQGVQTEPVGALTGEKPSSDTDLIEPGPAENVDQTVLGNEKRLASATSSAEVFDLLHKLRIRMKKLGDISKVASSENYAKFFGRYEGPVVNRRGESVFKLKLELKKNPDPAMPTISGSFELDKAKDGQVKGDFNGDFGMQLSGRDSLVISNTLEMNNFQLYKLENGMVAGNYYEKQKSSYKVYKFILKPK